MEADLLNLLLSVLVFPLTLIDFVVTSFLNFVTFDLLQFLPPA